MKVKNNLLVALLGIGIAGIGFGLITPVSVILLEKSHTPGWITGMITMVGYFAIFVFSGYAGKLYDKYSLKRLLQIGLVLWTLGALGHIFWYNLYLLFFVKLIMGFGGTLVFIGTEVLINYSSTSENRGKNIGIYATLLSIGIAVGTLLIWTVEIADYLPFVIGGSIMVIVTVFITGLLENIKIESSYNEQKVFRLRNMPAMGIFSALIYGLFESSVIVAVPLYGLRSGFNQNEVSYLLASFVIGGIVLLYAISYFSDIFSKYNVILTIAFLLSLLLIIPLLSKQFWLLMVLLFVLGGIIPAFYTIGLGYTVDVTNKRFITYANSYFIMMYGLGTLLGPLWGSLLVELNLSWGYWLISSILCFIFFLIFFLNKNSYQKAINI